MLWNYTHLHKNNTYGFDRLVGAMKAVDETVVERYVFDLYAVSQIGIPLRFTEPRLAIWFAHNEKFLVDCIQPLVFAAHGKPIPVVRRSWLPTPYVISDVIPINELTIEKAMEPSVPRPPPSDIGFDVSMDSKEKKDDKNKKDDSG